MNIKDKTILNFSELLQAIKDGYKVISQYKNLVNDIEGTKYYVAKLEATHD